MKQKRKKEMKEMMENYTHWNANTYTQHSK